MEHADRIIVMNEGEINGIGTHEELLAGNDIYREVYESQNGAGANADFDEEASSNKEVNSTCVIKEEKDRRIRADF